MTQRIATASASETEPRGAVSLPFVVMALLVVLSIFTGNVAAEELAIPLSFSGKIETQLTLNRSGQRAPRVMSGVVDSQRAQAGILIRVSGHIRFTPVVDAKSDVTSVRAASPSLSGDSSERRDSNFFGSDNSGILLLPGENGRYASSQTASDVVVGGAAEREVAAAEVALSNDDFLGHIREFLQTKK